MLLDLIRRRHASKTEPQRLELVQQMTMKLSRAFLRGRALARLRVRCVRAHCAAYGQGVRLRVLPLLLLLLLLLLKLRAHKNYIFLCSPVWIACAYARTYLVRAAIYIFVRPLFLFLFLCRGTLGRPEPGNAQQTAETGGDGEAEGADLMVMMLLLMRMTMRRRGGRGGGGGGGGEGGGGGG